MNTTAIRGFGKLCFSTLIAVYVLILVGGIVRSSGSGMGCPDWPKCFGQWSPPTDVSQLPPNYKEINSAFREKKNQKFIRYLHAFGFTSAAERMEKDKSVLSEDDFSVAKAWIEYSNRIVGVLIGFFIIALFWKSIPLRKEYPDLFYVALAVLAAVIIQGWFGSIVVSTNLTTWTVTVHMLLALVIVALLVYLLRRSEPPGRYSAAPGVRGLLVAGMAALITQLFLGTQVRESIDFLASFKAPREIWIGALGDSFLIHRSWSLLVLAIHLVLLYKLQKTGPNSSLSLGLLLLLLGAFLTGVGMAFWAVPAVFQPTHLVLATGAIGVQLLLLFRLTIVNNQPV